MPAISKRTDRKVNPIDDTSFLHQQFVEVLGTRGTGSCFTQVKRKSIVANGKSQTPTVNASPALGDNWKQIKLR